MRQLIATSASGPELQANGLYLLNRLKYQKKVGLAEKVLWLKPGVSIISKYITRFFKLGIKQGGACVPRLCFPDMPRERRRRLDTDSLSTASGLCSLN